MPFLAFLRRPIIQGPEVRVGTKVERQYKPKQERMVQSHMTLRAQSVIFTMHYLAPVGLAEPENKALLGR